MPILWLPHSRFGESGSIIERRIWPSQLAFCLAVLSKETAIITPLAFALWEILPHRDHSIQSRFQRISIALVPVLPLLAWLLYHYHATGRFFGNADFYQYNVTQALNPLRFLLALMQRSLASLWNHEHAGAHGSHVCRNVFSANH